MAEDVAPKLWALIKSDFDRAVKADIRIQEILSKIEKETAASEDVAYYSMYLGEHAGKALTGRLKPKNLPNGILYWNIADRTIRPMLEVVHDLVNDAAVTVYEAENRKIGINLRALRTEFPEERVRDLIDTVVDMWEGGAEDEE